MRFLAYAKNATGKPVMVAFDPNQPVSIHNSSRSTPFS
jgi:hypothetical protein